MSNAFDAEGGFMSAFSNAVDTLILAIVWLICCIPVITVGASSSALYYAYHKAIRRDCGHACKYFFKAFASNFKKATVSWLLLLILFGISAFTCYLLTYLQQSSPTAGIFMAIVLVNIVLVVVWCLYLFPYQARFENTIGNILKNSALLAVANAPRSILLLVIFGAAVALVLYKPAMIAPATAVYIWLANKILERIFRKFMTEEDLRSELEQD